jgi:hypothetical protein
MARWNEMAFGQPRAHHEPGCTGHCEGECQREFMALFCAAYSREGQAPVTSETPVTARERISTPALGVELMATVVGERLR